MNKNDDPAHDVRPHDLLWVPGVGALQSACAAPQWVEEAMAATPVVVVRRAVGHSDEIPVGVRGKTRVERFAAYVSTHAVCKRVAPEELAKIMRWRENRRAEFSAIGHALDSIAAEWSSIAWGPAGSVGFELATDVAVTTRESDLDLVIRAPQRITKSDAKALSRFAGTLKVRADVRIETRFGSIALQEYASPAAPKILMKTCEGSKLVEDPWIDPLDEVWTCPPGSTRGDN